MIRFIDIRNQGTGYRFAFFTTSTDTFEIHSDSQVWDTWDEFEQDYEGNDIERYRRLCSDWAFEEGEDDLDAFYGD